MAKCKRIGKPLENKVVYDFEKEFVQCLKEFMKSLRESLDLVKALKDCIVDYSLDNFTHFFLEAEHTNKPK